MPETCDVYSQGIKKTLKNYWAAWLPSSRFDLGDIGVLNGYYFEKVGSLSELGLKFEKAQDDDAASIELASESGLTLAFKLAGEVNQAFAHVPQGNAGLRIHFGAQGAYVVQASATHESAIADPMSLQRKIISAFTDGHWDKAWVVIVRIVTAPSASILICNSANSDLELSAEVAPSVALADLGKADFGFSVRYQQGDILKMIDARNISPFFQLGKLKRHLFAKPKFVTRSMRASDQAIANVTPSAARSDKAVSESLFFDIVQDEELPQSQI